MANTTGTTALSFSFSNQALSVLMIDGEPWFVASDVTDALTLSTEATRRLDDDENGLRTVQTPGGQPHWYRHSFDELIHSHMTFSAMAA